MRSFDTVKALARFKLTPTYEWVMISINPDFPFVYGFKIMSYIGPNIPTMRFDQSAKITDDRLFWLVPFERVWERTLLIIAGALTTVPISGSFSIPSHRNFPLPVSVVPINGIFSNAVEVFPFTRNANLLFAVIISSTNN